MNARTASAALSALIAAAALTAPALAQEKMGKMEHKMGKMEHKMGKGMAGKMQCAACAKATKANHGKMTMCKMHQKMMSDKMGKMEHKMGKKM